MKLILAAFGHALLFIALTALTQIGGVLWLVSRLVRMRFKRKLFRRLVFPVLYGLVWLVTPWLAAPYGRVPLPIVAKQEVPLQPQHFISVLANRHYVRSELREEVLAVARELQSANDGMVLTYLDANFPFIEGFPLLPHRSHDDGKKLDLAFFYAHKGTLTSKAPAFLGYGRCAEPKAGEQDQAAQCAKRGYWQYSLLKIVGNPFARRSYELAPEATAQMVRAFARRKTIGKLFLEPHLKTRWGLQQYNKIRFHGCAAVRHDDHLHIQL